MFFLLSVVVSVGCGHQESLFILVLVAASVDLVITRALIILVSVAMMVGLGHQKICVNFSISSYVVSIKRALFFF